ncbi:unnamed protein product [Pseudo-nitzschia multistriata]|uniref:Uncharacterized protein n=1 Tax=Pseudo-nitzschia multistriata TaxID=183589 RepID=A0A448Z347_9STRA|nr:unnamed protein product [Pseudo-nitzschia multistriata]
MDTEQLKPIPCKVKCCLKELSPANQVVLRGYIATLRAELKDKDDEIRKFQQNGGDPEAKKAKCGEPASSCKKGCCD